MAAIGSRIWQRKTQGRLSRIEQIQVVAGLVWQRARTLLGSSSPDRAGLARLDPATIVVPDSRIATRSEAHCRDCSNDSLYLHCVRSYFWAGLLAQYDGQTYDPERLYVALMLHDLGLTDGAQGKPEAHCFAVQGARMAAEFLADQGAPATFYEPIEDAIGLHINADVPLETYGAETHYLQAGTFYDVLGGSRFRHISAECRHQIVARWPREGFKEDVVARLEQEGRVHPRGRMSLLLRLGAARLITRHPLS